MENNKLIFIINKIYKVFIKNYILNLIISFDILKYISY